MGALTSNRKRVDEYFSLQSPFLSFNSLNCHSHCDRIETRVSKKPRLSYEIEISKKVSSLPQNSTLSRLNRYPKPTQNPRREIHAPCKVTRFGFLSSKGSGLRSNFSGFWEKAENMGNILSYKYQKAKEHALATLRSAKIDEVIGVEPEPKKKCVVSDDSSDVEIIEDGNEIRSVVTDDHRVKEPDGLRLETPKVDGKRWENDVVPANSPSISDWTKVGHANKMFDSSPLGLKELVDEPVVTGPVHKRLLGSVQRSHSKTISPLDSEIKLTEAKLHFLRLNYSLKKPVELKKPEEDILHEAFVPLSEEEKKGVSRAFSNANRRKVLVTHDNSNIEITGEILQCLRPGAWLNDEVINVYLELLKEREQREPKKFLTCHFCNTFFYKKLIGGRNGYDYKAVRRWTSQKKLGYGLIDCDKIFVPIHKEVHWCLAVINKKDKKFQYLDSLGGIDSQVMKVLARYIVDEVKDKSGIDIDVTSWEREFVEDLPEQQNGFDCGVFMIKYADFYSRGMGLHFSQEDMPYFRQRTAKEILRLRAD